MDQQSVVAFGVEGAGLEAGNRQAGVIARFNVALLRAGASVSGLAAEAGVSPFIVQKVRVRGSIPRHPNVRRAITRVLGVPDLWLWHGRADEGAEAGARAPDVAPRLVGGGAWWAVDDDRSAPIALAGEVAYISSSSVPNAGDRVCVRRRGAARYEFGIAVGPGAGAAHRIRFAAGVEDVAPADLDFLRVVPMIARVRPARA